MSDIELDVLKDKIEKLEKFHQVQILEILVQNNIPFTENRNGVFINMIKIRSEVILKIKEYLLYVTNQNSHLESTEELKKQLKHNFFNKDNKDKSSSLNI